MQIKILHIWTHLRTEGQREREHCGFSVCPPHGVKLPIIIVNGLIWGTMLTLTPRLHLFELAKSEGVTRPPCVIRHEHAQNARINRSDMCEIRVQIPTRSQFTMASHTHTHVYTYIFAYENQSWPIDAATWPLITALGVMRKLHKTKTKRRHSHSHTHTHAQTGIEIQSSIAHSHTHTCL